METETLKESLSIKIGDSQYLKFPTAFKNRYDTKGLEPDEVTLKISNKTTELTFVFQNENLKEKK